MKKSAYIITKPLQYVNAANIPDSNSKDCLLCNEFDNATEFCSHIAQYSNHWDNVKLFSTKYTALFYVIKHKKQFDKLYLDSDFGVILTLLLFFVRRVNIYTYEEGYASYTYLRPNRGIKNKVAKVISKLLCCEDYSGGGVFTKGMYLYDQELFNKNIRPSVSKPILSFSKTFTEQVVGLNEVNHTYSTIGQVLVTNRKIVIYLSYWKAAPDIVNILSSYEDYYRVLKLHPNIVGDSAISSTFDLVIPNNHIVEYYILLLVNTSAQVVVIHHGSFAMHYIKGYKNLSEVILKMDT